MGGLFRERGRRTCSATGDQGGQQGHPAAHSSEEQRNQDGQVAAGQQDDQDDEGAASARAARGQPCALPRVELDLHHTSRHAQVRSTRCHYESASHPPSLPPPYPRHYYPHIHTHTHTHTQSPVSLAGATGKSNGVDMHIRQLANNTRKAAPRVRIVVGQLVPTRNQSLAHTLNHHTPLCTPDP